MAGCKTDVTDADIDVISISQTRAYIEGKDASKVMLVDPRAESDYNAGHLPGAQNLGLNSERAKTGDKLNPIFDGYKYIIVYGDDPASGPAKAMAKRLMMKDADGVKFFAGGLVEWRRAGLKIEKSGAESAGTGTDATKRSETLGK